MLLDAQQPLPEWRMDQVGAVAEIERLVRVINHAWLAGEPAGMAPHLAEDVVFVAPGFEARTVGRQAALDSYAEFVAGAAVREFQTFGETIDLFGDTAVVSYRFAIRYEMAGGEHDESGHEILLFARREGAWGLVWRTLEVPPPGP